MWRKECCCLSCLTVRREIIKGTEPQGTEPLGTEPLGTEPQGTEPRSTEPPRAEPYFSTSHYGRINL